MDYTNKIFANIAKDISEKLFETECILLERDKNEIN